MTFSLQRNISTFTFILVKNYNILTIYISRKISESVKYNFTKYSNKVQWNTSLICYKKSFLYLCEAFYEKIISVFMVVQI